MGYWKDPDFDPKQRAFYYVRVLEIPTPRWTTYDAVFFGVDRPKNVLSNSSGTGLYDPHLVHAEVIRRWYTDEKNFQHIS